VREFDEEIREIKKEIIESRSLVIKTNNLTNALSSDVKSIARRQSAYERKLTWNGVAAYAIFALLLGVGAHMAYDARSAQGRDELARMKRRTDRLTREVGQYRDQLDQRLRAGDRALEFYELVRAGKRAEAVDRWDALQKERLSSAEMEVFRDSVERFKSELSLQAYEDGLERSRVERWAEAVSYFENALEIKSDTTHAPLIRLELANAYRHTGRAREAILLLEPLLQDGVARTAADDACWLLAETHIGLGEYEEARGALRTLQRRFPNSKHAGPSRLRMMEIAHRR